MLDRRGSVCPRSAGRQRRIFPLALLAPLALPCAARTAGAQVVGAGDRVRVHPFDGPPVVGVLASAAADTLRLQVGREGRPLAVPLWTVGRVDVARSRTRGGVVLRAAAVGLAVGAVFGGGLGAATCSGGSDGFGGSCRDAGKRATFIAGGAALVGVPLALLGSAIGAAAPLERWERVGPPLRVALAPLGGRGVALALTPSLGYRHEAGGRAW